MTRFNQSAAATTRTENLAGGEAFVQSPKLELVSILLTSFVQDQFYRSEKSTTKRLIDLMGDMKDKKFVAKAAIYARTKYGMRSVSHIVAAELGRMVQGEEWTKRFFNKIVYRPDDMLEIAAYFLQANNKRDLKDPMKKGFAQALTRFDAYQLAKYRGEGKFKSLVDLVNMTHPQSTEALAKLIRGELRSTQTWETKLTQAGQTAKDETQKAALKEKAWVDLIGSRKLGYFALLKNLRNIMEQAPEVVPQALQMLLDRHLIKSSLVLPFRFVTAIEEIEKVPSSGAVLRALSQALDIAIDNVPRFDGKTLVALDISGSMMGKTQEIAGVFAAVLLKANDADLMRFDDSASYKSVNTADSTLSIARAISASDGGTDLNSVFRQAAIAKRPYDRIIVLSDMQSWISYRTPGKVLEQYQIATGSKPHIFSFDLAGHGTLQFPESRVYCLAGFSEKAFDVMKLLEADRQALINEIEKIAI